MRQFFASRGCTLLSLALLILPLAGRGQSLTQADFTGVVVPQYTSSGTAMRLPVVYRATVSNLTPSTLYRYYTQAGISTDLGANVTGAGNPVLITPGATATATTYAYTSSASLTVAGGYATFTTNATGTYTGWFGFVNTGNARFTPGNSLYMTISLATDAVPGTVVKRLALDQTLTVLALGTGTTATDATGFRGASSATPKNLVAVYGNEAGTGRPLSQTVVEAIAATGSTLSGLPAYYTANAGDWNTLIPNVLATGVRRVEQRSVVDGTVVGCASDADGAWPSGTNTVNPVVGIAALSLTATDAPLNTSACGGTATAAVTATPASLNAFSATVGTPSANQTITVAGTSLTADVVVTAPAGYEVSLAAASGFATSVMVAQTGGTTAATPVYVRLTGAATGTFAGNVTVASTGATTQNVAVTGTVNAVGTQVPVITSLAPNTVAAGYSAFTLTVNGTDFTGTSVVNFGTTPLVTTAVSATQLTAAVPAGTAAGTYAITVTNPGSGGGTSSAVNFMVTSAPTLTSLSPNTAVAGSAAFLLTATGTDFSASSVITFNGVALTTTFVSATSITATVPAAAIATMGTVPVTITTGGTASAAVNFTITAPAPAPTVTSFSPARAITGVGFTLAVSGTNLVAGTTINFNGASYTGTVLGTSGTGYTVAIPASGVPAPGTYNITATNGGATSGPLSFLVVAAATGTTFEDFEQGSKGSYTAGTVTLRSGDWTFTDALIGALFNDRVNQVKAARIRGGSIAMNFDKPNGAGIITLSSAIYGNDASASFTLEISTNGGTSYTLVPGTPTALTTTLTPHSFTVNQTGNVRLRINNTNTTSGTNPRINIDDIIITDYIGTATLAANALPGLAVFPNPATDRVTVSLPTSAPATVALRDLTGRVVLAPAVLGADRVLRLPASLASGLYLLEVQQNGVKAVRRIEKN